MAGTRRNAPAPPLPLSVAALPSPRCACYTPLPSYTPFPCYTPLPRYAQYALDLAEAEILWGPSYKFKKGVKFDDKRAPWADPALKPPTGRAALPKGCPPTGGVPREPRLTPRVGPRAPAARTATVCCGMRMRPSCRGST